jgi:16S rRNA (uracil1498-N3)-methyltransferase
MQYLFEDKSGEQNIILRGDSHHYIFKVRRHRQNELIALRNLKDNILYLYKIISIDKKEATLELMEEKSLQIIAKKELHIGWCLIDIKNIEKVLPSLNEIGVSKITFISCARSQQNNKIDIQRLQRIVLNSSQQCGRSRMMEFETVNSLKDFIALYPDSYMLNFSQNRISNNSDIETIVIGCEGGFTDKEISFFDTSKIVGFDTPLILKSESAVCAVAGKLLV